MHLTESKAGSLICLDAGRAARAQGIYLVDECRPERCIELQNGSSGQDEISAAGVTQQTSQRRTWQREALQKGEGGRQTQRLGSGRVRVSR